MSELESGFRLADVIDLLRRRSAIVLAGAILGLIAGYLVFASAPPTYSATSRVEVTAISDEGGDNAGTVEFDLGTEADKVRSDAVGDDVRAELSLSGDNRSLFRPLIVTVQERSRVLALTYESESASEARDVVNAVARAYLTNRSQESIEDRDGQVADIEEQLAESNAALTDANTALDATEPGSSARLAAQDAVQRASREVNDLDNQLGELRAVDTDFGELVREAPLPSAVLSKKALATGVGVFGLFTMAAVAAALFVDRRDAMGGGRRKVEQLVPGANIRMMPSAVSRNASPAEVDAAIDRLAVELAGGGSRGRATSVLVVGTRSEPPIAMAEELAASLTFAGIPSLFVLAGASDREIRQAHVIVSFTDLITGPSIIGPASLPDVAGAGAASTPLVTWLRPRGSAESSGLLRRAVVEALITRAGREGFEAVVFVAATPTRNAAAAALGQWTTKTAVIVDGEESQGVESAVGALAEADVSVTEVVWT